MKNRLVAVYIAAALGWPGLAMAVSGDEAPDQQVAVSAPAGLAQPTDLQVISSPEGPVATDNGTLAYAVRFDLPPGRLGVRPPIELRYDSSLGNGMAGVGWYLSGLPAIVRIPHDRGVQFQGTDT